MAQRTKAEVLLWRALNVRKDEVQPVSFRPGAMAPQFEAANGELFTAVCADVEAALTTDPEKPYKLTDTEKGFAVHQFALCGKDDTAIEGYYTSMGLEELL